MTEGQQLARRDDRRAAIEAIMGTGDIRMMVAAAKANAEVAIEIARARGFVTDYDLKDKNGNVTGQRAFFHLPTWQLLSQAWGITAFTDGEPREVKPGTWQAAAVAQTIEDGRIVGRAVALCARSEPGKKFKGDHDLAATAQSRAQRNALRSCLGALLIAAGVDIVDPEGPATPKQVGVLHQLARELDWPDELAHEMAGVGSFKDLNRDQAGDLIESWTEMRDAEAGGPAEDGEANTTETTPSPVPPASESPPGARSSTPSSAESLTTEDRSEIADLRSRALRKYGNKPREVEKAYGPNIRFTQMSADQLREVLE